MVRKIFFKVILFCIALSVFLFQPQVYAEDKIIAVVNNEIITQKDLDDFMNFMNFQLSSRYKNGELEEKVKEMVPDLINKLVDDRLILQQAKKDNIAIDGVMIKARLEEMKSRYPSELEFQKALSNQGITFNDIESKIKEQLLIYQMIELNAKNKITVNPREVTEYYNQHIEEFSVPESREVTALAIKDEGQIDKISDLVKQGISFDEVTAVYGAQINNLGLVYRQQLKNEIEEAIFELDVDGVSAPIKINQEYYIFKVEEIHSRRNLSLSEAQDLVYERVFEMKFQQRLKVWLSELKEKSYVKIK